MFINKSTPKGCFQPQTLDIDGSIIERNLTLLHDPGPAPISRRPEASISLPAEYSGDSLHVTPSPGICVKTRNVKGTKVFINLCKVQEIPPATPIQEADLIKIVENEDYETPYKVPMSLGSPREDKTKAGDKCLVCDVAVNSMWFDETLMGSAVFTAFTISVIMEGLCDKYGDAVNLDRNGYTILNNKTYHGKLQRHHVQKREKKIMEVKKSITEVSCLTNSLSKKPALTLKKEGKNLLKAEIHLPGICSGSQLDLDLGEDRVKLESATTAKGYRYTLDVYIPINIHQESSMAKFHKKLQLLEINMPLVSRSKCAL